MDRNLTPEEQAHAEQILRDLNASYQDNGSGNTNTNGQGNGKRKRSRSHHPKGGPRTPEGKRKSCLNATKHGLTGQTVVLPQDDLQVYNSHVDRITREWEAVTYQEKLLAKSIADCFWRLERLKGMEHGTFAIGHMYDLKVDAGHEKINDTLSDAQSFHNEGKTFALYTLYEQRIHRTRRQDEARLKELIEARNARDEARKVKEAQDFQQAKDLAMVAYMEGRDYDPQADGFVFSSAEIRDSLLRDERLKAAAHYKKHGYDRNHQYKMPWPLLAKAA